MKSSSRPIDAKDRCSDRLRRRPPIPAQHERAGYLRRADELKSKFLSNMSHGFRTPLNSVLALSRLLLARTDGDLTPEQQKRVQSIRKSAESVRDSLTTRSTLAKVEAGTVVTPIEFKVEDLFGALRGMLRPLLVGDAVALIFEDAEEVPALADPAQFPIECDQVYRNRRGARLEHRGFGSGHRLRSMSVIPVSALPKKTSAFFPRSSARSRIRCSRGSRVPDWGPPLSKRLAELLDGSIVIQSVPTEGSVSPV